MLRLAFGAPRAVATAAGDQLLDPVTLALHRERPHLHRRIEWIADRSLASPFGPGGVARGLEVLRRSNGDVRLLCVLQLGVSSRLTVLKGPFQFGLGHLGRMDMRGGLPAFGNVNFQAHLSGCPTAVAAILYLGFSNTLTGGVPLPIDLTPLGLDESDLAIDPAMSFPLQFFANGTTSQPIPLPPPSIVFQNVPAYFQWLATASAAAVRSLGI